MKSNPISLNCDMGESYGHWKMGNDEKVMPFVDQSSIACGFHASDPVIMSRTIRLALKYDVQIGAHPSYPDMQGFGRRSIPMTIEEITSMVIYQVGALKALCESVNAEISYIKPHGALYNDMLKDIQIFEAVVDAASCFNVPLMMLAIHDKQDWLDVADNYDVPLLFEAFADRRYLATGQLAPRTMPGSVMTDEDEILNQVTQIARYGKVRTLDGYTISLEADTICVHGDNDDAINMIEKIRQTLKMEGS
ncbi:5-oxoprolinase subunit PxpA [Vibrio japonicus]|uniref:5-oxoprolinase subunit A n=1 Tax=Vibrio japonicus TaxID=1824638 RepID=A0ABY5LKI7_9VIBR|nr:5-oxoprolinase subunit PxpA [Vibrio japonicus]UUM32594.1 5-oxoprolinase subunit PxpA [Vibrio japonicus]